MAGVVTEDKLEGLEEANPFSFKEFLKTKNRGLLDSDSDTRAYSKVGTFGQGQCLGYGPRTPFPR